MKIFLIIICVVILLIIGLYNNLVRLRQNVRREKRGIDVYLKQRFDLIPNLVETVKGYAAHEKEIMENIAKLRSDYASRDDQNIQEAQSLNDRYTKLIATLESYPELKANQNFLALQKALSKI